MKNLLKLTAALIALSCPFWGCSATETITICKQTTPAGGGSFPFTVVQGSAGPTTTFSLNDTQCNTFNLTNQDHYNTFTENVPAGWMLANITCNHTTSAVKFIGSNANPAFQPGDNTVAIDLNEANVTCTFINRQLPACCAYNFNLSTGQGNGLIDPLWSVDNATAYITPPAGAWMSLPQAQWIQPVASPTPSNSIPVGTYQYKVRINVPDCPMGHVELTGTFAADNRATAFLDGIAIPGATCAGPLCFDSPEAPVPLNVPSILPGIHVLQIDVYTQSNYSGLTVNAQVRRICP